MSTILLLKLWKLELEELSLSDKHVIFIYFMKNIIIIY